MSDVYISYTRADQELAGRIAKVLEGAGLVVTWDLAIPVGQSFAKVIERAISDAKCVVALWSHTSVGSAWVLDEADYAKGQNKLLPVIVGDVEPPLGFRSIHALDLRGWYGGADDGRIERLIVAVRATIERSNIGVAPPKVKVSPPSIGSEVATAVTDVVLPGAQTTADKATPFAKPWGAASTQIFVAHTTSDKPRIAPIVSILLSSGFHVWIDKPHLLGLRDRRLKGIEYGSGDWKEQIRKAVNRAKIVLALWSNDAIDARREQFYYEVYMGLVQGKLCQARLDPLPPGKIGMPFTFDQVADLSDFSAGAYHAELDYMIAGFPKFRRRRFN